VRQGASTSSPRGAEQQNVTNFTERSPSSEADSRSVTPEVSSPRLWNPKVHHRVHESPPLFPNLCHMTPLPIPIPCLRMVPFAVFQEDVFPPKSFMHFLTPHPVAQSHIPLPQQQKCSRPVTSWSAHTCGPILNAGLHSRCVPSNWQTCFCALHTLTFGAFESRTDKRGRRLEPSPDTGYLLWKWKQYVPSKHWYPPTRLYGVTMQTTEIWSVSWFLGYDFPVLFTPPPPPQSHKTRQNHNSR
jgi:hypothetical protein